MRRGAIEQLGRPDEVFEEPATEYVADFIGMANRLVVRAPRRAAGRTRARVEGDLGWLDTASTDDRRAHALGGCRPRAAPERRRRCAGRRISLPATVVDVRVRRPPPRRRRQRRRDAGARAGSPRASAAAGRAASSAASTVVALLRTRDARVLRRRRRALVSGGRPAARRELTMRRGVAAPVRAGPPAQPHCAAPRDPRLHRRARLPHRPIRSIRLQYLALKDGGAFVLAMPTRVPAEWTDDPLHGRARARLARDRAGARHGLAWAAPLAAARGCACCGSFRSCRSSSRRLAGVLGWAFLLSPHPGLPQPAAAVLPWWSGFDGPFDVYSMPWIIIITGLALASFVYLFVAAGFENINQRADRGSLRLRARRAPACSSGCPAAASPVAGLRTGVALLLGLGQFTAPLLLGQNQGVSVAIRCTNEVEYIKKIW